MLRSGYAKEADQAFGLGAAQHADENGVDRFEMYLPWEAYNNAPREDANFITVHPTADLAYNAKCAYQAQPNNEHKPKWDDLKDPTKLLLIRNAAIIAGINLDNPVKCVLCWTPNGDPVGGTGHAIQCALLQGISVFNLALEYDRQAASEFIHDATSEHWEMPW